jgi:hypothetical protein
MLVILSFVYRQADSVGPSVRLDGARRLTGNLALVIPARPLMKEGVLAGALSIGRERWGWIIKALS